MPHSTVRPAKTSHLVRDTLRGKLNSSFAMAGQRNTVQWPGPAGGLNWPHGPGDPDAGVMS